MTSSTKTDAKPTPEDAVKQELQKTPGGATIEGIARTAGIGRSTAGKMLARLADVGEITRHPGGRVRGKRLPDRFTLTGLEIPAADATDEPPSASAGEQRAEPAGETKPAAAAASQPAGQDKPEGAKLKPGGLDPLVLGYLKDHADTAPHGPTSIAKALQRSSGAVGNCLERLTDAKKVTLVTAKPRRYQIAS